MIKKRVDSVSLKNQINPNSMDTFLGIAGLLVGIAGLIIAWFQYEGKRKLTHAFQSALKGMTGNIAKIQQSTKPQGVFRQDKRRLRQPGK